MQSFDPSFQIIVTRRGIRTVLVGILIVLSFICFLVRCSYLTPGELSYWSRTYICVHQISYGYRDLLWNAPFIPERANQMYERLSDRECREFLLNGDVAISRYCDQGKILIAGSINRDDLAGLEKVLRMTPEARSEYVAICTRRGIAFAILDAQTFAIMFDSANEARKQKFPSPESLQAQHNR